MKKELKTLSLGLALVIGGGITSVALYKQFESPTPISSYPNEENNNYFANNKIDLISSPNLEMAAEMSLNTVVHVKTEVRMNQARDPLYHFFYGNQRQQNPQIAHSSGSGVLISDDGYIVTNNHVIENAETLSITLNNNKSYNAELIGSDPNTDLALLKIDEDQLPYINYGNSNNLNIGEWVLAVGNPFNLTSTVTAGIVSAKGRDINILKNDPYSGMSSIESFIQTDAAVNPGNSGGALVNASGELIGINTAIKSNTGSYTGYSFAVPVNIVKKVVNDLKEFGTVQRAFIGVSIQNLDEQLANKIGTDNLNGVFINGTTENGSAAKAGIKSGDIIKKIGTKSIKNVAELQEQIGQFRPGDNITVVVERNNKELKLPVVLKNLNGTEQIVSNQTNKILKRLGVKLAEVSDKELKLLKINEGVKIKEIYNGKLRSVGIREGFIITKVNHKKVSTTDDLIAAVNQIKGGILIEGVYENGRKEFYGFGL
ncbi:MAG: trypsin-like peptidase domain-containing protein [Vicingaceae bacterium]